MDEYEWKLQYLERYDDIWLDNKIHGINKNKLINKTILLANKNKLINKTILLAINRLNY